MSDEIALGRAQLSDFAATVAHRMIDEMRQPEQQAAFAGAIILPLVVCRRSPPLPVLILLALIGDQAGRMLYRAGANLEAIAQASRGA